MGHEAIQSFYERLVRDYGSALYRYAYHCCSDVDLAEDLVAETFAEAWRSIKSLRDRKKAKAWIYQILRYRVSRWRRERLRRPEIHLAHEEMLAEVAAPTVDMLDTLATREILQEALTDMDERFRDAFLLVFQGGFSCREAADLLEIPLGTALSRIHRARNILQKAFIHSSSGPIAYSPSRAKSNRPLPPIPMKPRRSR